MGSASGWVMLGPIRLTGSLPIPHVLVFYAIFFGFGVIYFRHDDPSGRVERRWWRPLAIALFVAFPLANAFVEGWTGPFDVQIGPLPRRLISTFLQAAYAWLVTFGLMGMFRQVCSAENARVRYLSDSAYWLYLVHLPSIIAAQYIVRDWPVPGLVKSIGIVLTTTLLLLLSYQALVRYTWLGRFLNGPRVSTWKVNQTEAIA